MNSCNCYNSKGKKCKNSKTTKLKNKDFCHLHQNCVKIFDISKNNITENNDDAVLAQIDSEILSDIGSTSSFTSNNGKLEKVDQDKPIFHF